MAMLFISHAPQDDDVALRVYNGLKTAGIDAWVDNVYTKPDDNWLQVIEAAIHEAAVGVFLASPAAVRSPAAVSECRYFLAHNKPLHVAQIREVDRDDMPYHMRELPTIDLTHDFDSGLSRLAEMVRMPAEFVAQRAFANGNHTEPIGESDVSLTVEANLQEVDSNRFADLISRLTRVGIRNIRVKNRGD